MKDSARTVVDFPTRRRDDITAAVTTVHDQARRSAPGLAVALPIDLPAGELSEEFAEVARTSARADRYRAHQAELQQRKAVRLQLDREHAAELSNARRTSQERGEREGYANGFSTGLNWGFLVGVCVGGYAIAALIYAGKWVGA